MPAPAREATAGPPAIRAARSDDVPRLIALEREAFATDRLTRGRLRAILARGRAVLLLAEAGGRSGPAVPPRLLGYVLVLLRRGSRLARLYSLAVDPDARGCGIGAALLTAAEKAATCRGAERMRLEVRPANGAALALYHRRGYREFDRVSDYYEDHSSAIRLEKQLEAGTGA